MVNSTATRKKPTPAALVVFGATGDLTQNKIYPSLYELARRDLLPHKFYLYGVSRQEMTVDDFKQQVRENLKPYVSEIDEKAMSRLLRHVHYFAADLNDQAVYDRLEKRVKSDEARIGAAIMRTFYLALPPELFEQVIGNVEACRLGKALCTVRGVRSRVIVEKPFGSDLTSARRLNRKLRNVFDERQIYRIDHYLGKESVQNIYTFLFANHFFESVWNREHVDHIQVNALETVGIEGRRGYYDSAGVVRDMLQNHLLQLVAYLTMDEPSDATPASLHRVKERLLGQIRPIDAGFAVFGQHKSYGLESGVGRKSKTPTFVAAKLMVDSERWRGVPIFVRTGKRLARKDTSATVVFKKRTPKAYPSTADTPNVLTFNIAPMPAITMNIHVKHPGFREEVDSAIMHYCRGEHYGEAPVADYERLLLDVFDGDQSLFASSKEVMRSWQIVEPLLSKDLFEHVGIYDDGGEGPTVGSLFGSSGAGWLALKSGCPAEKPCK